MKLFEFYCYRRYLRELLDHRRDLNPAYSLRAFAKQLTVSPSRLSEVINQKSHFGIQSIHAIAGNLFTNHLEANYFLQLYASEQVKCPKQKQVIHDNLVRQRLEYNFNKVSADNIAKKHWYHFAILMILSIDSQIELNRLGELLQLPTSLIAEALKDLRETGMIEGGSHKINDQHRFLSIDDHQAFNTSLHEAMMHKALDSLRRLKKDERLLNTIFFTIPRKDFPNFCELLQDTLKSMSIRPNRPEHDSVYALTVQAFPIAAAPTAPHKTDREK